MQLNLRFRHEFRFFTQKNLIQRSRIMARLLFTSIFKNVSPLLQTEHFYSWDSSQLFEQRYMAGFQLKTGKKLNWTPYYQLQIQSSIKALQHIVGLQLLISKRS